MAQKLYPIGVQDFKKLRSDGFCYVDKTELVYQLVRSGANAFLSRPRRFGKSLLCSTLKYYFEGEKELFKGLAIEQLEKDWIKRPVLYMNLNNIRFQTKRLGEASTTRRTTWTSGSWNNRKV